MTGWLISIHAMWRSWASAAAIVIGVLTRPGIWTAPAVFSTSFECHKLSLKTTVFGTFSNAAATRQPRVEDNHTGSVCFLTVDQHRRARGSKAEKEIDLPHHAKLVGLQEAMVVKVTPSYDHHAAMNVEKGRAVLACLRSITGMCFLWEAAAECRRSLLQWVSNYSSEVAEEHSGHKGSEKVWRESQLWGMEKHRER